MRFEKTEHRKDIINITPLIDLVLVLMIFFMLTISLGNEGYMSLSIGGEKRGIGTSAQRLVVVKKTEIVVEGKACDSECFAKWVDDALNENAETTFFLKPDETGTVQDLVSTMEAIQKRGGRKVSLL